MHTIKLLSLKCVEAQAFRGDEVYLKLNGETIWAIQNYKRCMKNKLTKPHFIDEFDFANGRMKSRAGWEEVPGHNPNDYVFNDLTESVKLELWDHEHALFLPDHEDFLGANIVPQTDDEEGTVVVMFSLNAACYRLTYELIRS
ncbi:MAG: hypothetical protein D6737_18965 [Chloroflexi bacterium]|nr:MAG: hypothetical protein D6737_18965 [Chloroflexota bacterium]